MQSEGSKSQLKQAWELAKSGSWQMAIQTLENQQKNFSAIELASLAHFNYLGEQFDASSYYASQSLLQDPHNRTALVTLAEIAIKKNLLNEARNYLEDACQFHRKEIFPVLRLTFVLCTQGEYDTAIQYLERAREYNSQNRELLKELIAVNGLAGNLRALAGLKKQLKDMEPSGDELDREQYISGLAKMPPDKAIHQLKTILSISSYREDVSLNGYMSELLMREKRFAEAVPYLEKIQIARPRSIGIKQNLIRCLVRSGRPVEALEILDGLEFSRDRPALQIARMEALATAGRLQEAMDLTFAFLLINPQNRAARRILNQLIKRGVKPSKKIKK